MHSIHGKARRGEGRVGLLLNDESNKMKWRLIKDKTENAAMLMAVDEAIFTARQKGLVPNTLRFFQWNPSAVSVGRFQSVEKEVDVDLLKEKGFDIVRRSTGGGAVFHDKELTYSFFVNKNDLKNGDDIIESYKEICNPIVLGMKQLGVDLEFVPINDLLLNGKKVSGNAQTRQGDFVLQHGTILLEVFKQLMFKLLKVPLEKMSDKQIKSIEERVTSLKDEGKVFDFDKIRSVLLESFEKFFGVEFVEEDLSDFEKELAQKLYVEKYSNDEWVFKR
jgi:lipoate-protein ligase A